MSDIDGGTTAAGAVADRPLEGVRICLVFEHCLSHYTRTRQQIAALEEAGAVVQLLGQNEAPCAPAHIAATRAPILRFAHIPDTVPPSTLKWRPARALDNRLRERTRKRNREEIAPRITAERHDAIRKIASQVDLFWVVDYPSLPDVVAALDGSGVKVLYETVDLVTEYEYEGIEARLALLADEQRLLTRIDGFVTASDSYADYYMEKYGGRELTRRPVVLDNIPARIIEAPKPAKKPYRILFMGSLMFDRPLVELIEAMSKVHSNVTLSFQGKNYAGGVPERRIEELGLQDRVFLLEPCEPDVTVDAAREYDIGIVALKGENENERRASTSKLFTYMASGLAVLGSDLPGIASVVNKYGVGQLVDGMGPDAWAEAIDQMAALPESRVDEMKRRSIEAAHLHSWERERPSFVGEFVRALGRSDEGGRA